ncbi:hypothetical protein [Streptodolium elevatio]|uniref:Uncharacterized protein n=1 Tax=Streptodolium elevatio TaxID=3157996 RepID=A0ABV3DNK7_9ACTN
MTPEGWRTARVELVPGYSVLGPDGASTADVEAAFAIAGGFLHLRVPGTGTVQVVSAPAVRRVTYADDSNAGRAGQDGREGREGRDSQDGHVGEVGRAGRAGS